MTGKVRYPKVHPHATWWHLPAELHLVIWFDIMAHWNDRDPRWLVKEMGNEGSNVNGWHWEERSLKKEARSKLDLLIQEIDAEMNPSIGTAKITGVTEMSGEVSLSPISYSVPNDDLMSPFLVFGHTESSLS
jgi:hypothetical protein